MLEDDASLQAGADGDSSWKRFIVKLLRGWQCRGPLKRHGDHVKCMTELESGEVEVEVEIEIEVLVWWSYPTCR
jgi:hypothetical protein